MSIQLQGGRNFDEYCPARSLQQTLFQEGLDVYSLRKNDSYPRIKSRLTVMSRAFIVLLLLGTFTPCCIASEVDDEAKQKGTACSFCINPSSSATSVTNTTLRDYLTHPDGFYLAMAPSFFGFFGYFGALTSWQEDALEPHLRDISSTTENPFQKFVRGTTGASAGAMAAILLAAGVPPRKAADFCSNLSLSDFADFPGFGALLKGHRFEDIMNEFITPIGSTKKLQLEDGILPVGVTGFDLQTWDTKVLTHGPMARAARASACFPTLFQPVGWMEPKKQSTMNESHHSNKDYDYSLFVDGGIQDTSGLMGLKEIFKMESQQSNRRRVINLVVGDFWLGKPPGPSSISSLVWDDADTNKSMEVLSISIRSLPSCGPWAMSNGPKAVEAARRVMQAALDMPLHVHARRTEQTSTEQDGRLHYELHMDASSFFSS